MKRLAWLLGVVTAVTAISVGCSDKPRPETRPDVDTLEVPKTVDVVPPDEVPDEMDEPADEPQDIVDTAIAAGSFQTLIAAVTAAGLTDRLKGAEPLTVFAPTDEAFAVIEAETLDELLKPENVDLLSSILAYHVVPGALRSDDLADQTSVITLQGEALTVELDGEDVLVGGANIVVADIVCSNGIIHVIDAVLLPRETEDELDADEEPDEMDEPAEPGDDLQDLVDTAIAAGEFETLVAVVQLAGLVDTLRGEGPFTVFAPTDEAFAQLDAETLAQLLEPENRDQLVAILTYHVVPGKVMAEDVAGLTTVRTVQGADISITVDGTTVHVGEATVIVADIDCSNGVIHVIDTVLIPPAPETEPDAEPSDPEPDPEPEMDAEPTEPAPEPELKDIVDTAAAAGQFSTLLAAVTAAELVDMAKEEGPFTVFAPNDEAFAKVGAEAIQELLLPENREQLVAILSYHVVPGTILAADLAGRTLATTAHGADVAIAVEQETVKVGGASVIAADIMCSNGVIHVIDAVLLPPEE